MKRKGIILAGGAGTRLYPLTKTISKQLLPIYNKPLIYYPLSTLMLAGIREVLIITTPEDLEKFKALLGDGSQLGIRLEYAAQEEPRGLAEAFLIGEEFIENSPTSLILGDNIYYGQGMHGMLQQANSQEDGALVFGCHVEDPSRYGIAHFDKEGKLTEIVEKPENPKSSVAITGLYFYDSTVVEKAKKVRPSPRGELEITDLNNLYLEEGKLGLVNLGRGFAWFDTGTFDSMLEASQFIKTVENRQNLMIGQIDEVAYRMGYTTKEHIETVIRQSKDSKQSCYLESLIHENT
ncbi:MAG: glucose-1-phosphate thymidylyltransferase [Alphaproteobacteria bacterium CG_4_10_14_0_8_um_filter_37_21]|nr:MAG: glucose-1-phosphate thymidylyltransferase [Alphaproteobacteria bacterium CG_4_10_14_0_8_um_filter_37_21]